MMEQKAFLGPSSIEKLLPVLQKYAPQHVFLVRGKKSYKTCGAKAIIDATLKKMHCEVTEFYDFEENPKTEDLEKGLSLLRQSHSSIIVGIGGGSVLDMSKLLRFFYSYSGELTGNKFEKTFELLPLIALPTTAGTGSEATHFAVLYKDKVKYSVEHDNILPDVVIVYPPFTYNNPKYLTACTGFDALAQGIEAYWNVNATKESDEYAERAIKLLWSNLPLAVNSPTEEIRDKVSEGSYWAGRAINITKTTAPHAFSYPFTTYYGYPHGHAVALTFPFFYKLNTSSHKKLRDGINKEIYNRKILFLLSLIENNYQKMNDYLQRIDLVKKIVLKENDIMNIFDGINERRLVNNPVCVTKDMKYEVVREMQ